MSLSTTFLFYAVIGIGVATAMWLRGAHDDRGHSAWQAVSAVFFWPLFIPVLLQEHNAASTVETLWLQLPSEERARPGPQDDMSAAIARVEAELDSALASLGGWSEDVLDRQQERIGELRAAWKAQAARIREIDALLIDPLFTSNSALKFPPAMAEASTEATAASPERIHNAERARQVNIVRLREVRRRMYSDLMGTLAWVRELVTMIHLAKFTGAPASRAEELVAQIAAAVEGLSEVCAWNPDHGTPSDKYADVGATPASMLHL